MSMFLGSNCFSAIVSREHFVSRRLFLGSICFSAIVSREQLFFGHGGPRQAIGQRLDPSTLECGTWSVAAVAGMDQKKESGRPHGWPHSSYSTGGCRGAAWQRRRHSARSGAFGTTVGKAEMCSLDSSILCGVRQGLLWDGY